MPENEKESGILSPPALVHSHDFYRTMLYHHWRRLCGFYQHYNPRAMPNCHKWLRQCSGHEDVLFEELRQIYGPEPAHLSTLEKARTRGAPDGSFESTAEEGILFQAFFDANTRAKKSEVHRAELEKEVVAFLAEKGVCSNGVSAHLVDSCDGDREVLFRALEGVLGRQRTPSLRAVPPLSVDLLSSRSHTGADWRKAPGFIRHRLRLADAAFPAASNFLELSEQTSLDAHPVRPTAAAPAFATVRVPSGSVHGGAVGQTTRRFFGDSNNTTHARG
ncbi:hypothetical protein TraAM80_02900 [Trypanosoma rangeli]|uniref:Uncharacterized protein n=1 Tax=Trypanosoma rangeli TaxID=5698 RepID=A0A422NRP4_TRYRA|nr:uncharacterized protein TraAM80_02900 [Trypanosoma rangeli]RNF08143.1 hypothetical protein TraAM80_02900 [Trypanosoma rangeli]|eukprot:RNF08143.1 hypothetical protein TraAM80_02900 [Trypanosoma rangeli]